MSSEKSSRIFSSSSEGSGGKKRRYHQSHLNETDDKNSKTGVGNDSTASQKDRVIKTMRRKKQEDKGYGIKNFIFGVVGDFQVFEDLQVDVNLKNRRPDMMLTMAALPQTKLNKRANEEGGQDENKQDINAAGNTTSLQQKYNRKDDRSLQNLEGDSTRIPLQELLLTNHRQDTQGDDLFRSMARLSYELRLENQIEHRRQLYLASIEANKTLAGLAQKNRQGN